MDLTKKHCKPCEGGTAPLTPKQVSEYSLMVPGWTADNDKKIISRLYKFKNFSQALDFVNKVGQIAESENHHPDISFGWGKAEITLTTHAINGLSDNDFIVAAKINNI